MFRKLKPTNPFRVWRNEAHVEAVGLTVSVFTLCLNLRSAEDGEARWINLRLFAASFFGLGRWINLHDTYRRWGPFRFTPCSNGIVLFTQTIYEQDDEEVDL